MYGSLAFEIFCKRRSPRFKTNRVTLLRNDPFLKRLMTKWTPVALVRTFFVELVMRNWDGTKDRILSSNFDQVWRTLCRFKLFYLGIIDAVACGHSLLQNGWSVSAKSISRRFKRYFENQLITVRWPSMFNHPLEYCWQSDSQLTTGLSNFRLIKKIFIKWSLTIG